jgi:single-strand DNA-binding protein
VKYSSKLDIFGFAEVLFHSLEIKVNFYSLVYTNFRSFVSIFEDKPRIYTALAVKYSSKLDIFARLLVYLQNKLIILLIMSVNKVILIGNVGKDPEVRHLDRNMAVANIVLATTERGYTLQNGTQVPDRTEWHNVVLWGGMADVVERYVRKGDKLYIEGKIRTTTFEDQSGIRRYRTEIQADNMEMLSYKSAGGQSTEGK